MKRRNWPDESGFSLIEVTLAVVVLGVSGLALIDGMQSTLLQSSRVDVSASASVTLAVAVDNITASPYVSCADSHTPYTPLRNGLTMPAGLTLTVREFLPNASTPWQDCQNVTTTGSSQYIVLTAADGSTRTLLRFAAGRG